MEEDKLTVTLKEYLNDESLVKTLESRLQHPEFRRKLEPLKRPPRVITHTKDVEN